MARTQQIQQLAPDLPLPDAGASGPEIDECCCFSLVHHFWLEARAYWASIHVVQYSTSDSALSA